MHHLMRQTGKIKIALVLVPMALSLSATATPVDDSSVDATQRMTFDSIGSMLQDMDREQSLAPQDGNISLPVSTHTNDRACRSVDVSSRMDVIYTRLQSRLEQIDFAEIARVETKIAMQRASDLDERREKQASLVREARASAASAIHAAITDMEELGRVAADQDEELAANALGEALRAAKATLISQPRPRDW